MKISKCAAGLVACLGAAALEPSDALADDCAAIAKALDLTANAPAIRQYISIPSRPGGERLMTVTLGDTVYMAIGGPGGWQKTARSEIMAMAAQAKADAKYRDCESLGLETLNGTQATIYAYTTLHDASGLGPLQSKIWVGSDGLVRKQQGDRGSVRYEYNDVKAPQ